MLRTGLYSDSDICLLSEELQKSSVLVSFHCIRWIMFVNVQCTNLVNYTLQVFFFFNAQLSITEGLQLVTVQQMTMSAV